MSGLTAERVVTAVRRDAQVEADRSVFLTFDLARGEPDADQGGDVREAEADAAVGPDGDPVGSEEHRAVGLDLGVAPDGGDHPLGGQPRQRQLGVVL